MKIPIISLLTYLISLAVAPIKAQSPASCLTVGLKFTNESALLSASPLPDRRSQNGREMLVPLLGGGRGAPRLHYAPEPTQEPPALVLHGSRFGGELRTWQVGILLRGELPYRGGGRRNSDGNPIGRGDGQEGAVALLRRDAAHCRVGRRRGSKRRRNGERRLSPVPRPVLLQRDRRAHQPNSGTQRNRFQSSLRKM